MRNKEAMREIAQLLDRIWTALVVRDPGTSTSADAYDGLRKQVAAAAQDRFTHLVQLAQFSDALERTEDADTLARLVREWMEQAGLERVLDSTRTELFEFISGGEPEVITPAYVDKATGRIIKQGRAKGRDGSDAKRVEERPTPDQAEEQP